MKCPKHNWVLVCSCPWKEVWYCRCGTSKRINIVDGTSRYIRPKHMQTIEPYEGTRKNGKPARRGRNKI